MKTAIGIGMVAHVDVLKPTVAITMERIVSTKRRWAHGKKPEEPPPKEDTQCRVAQGAEKNS